MRTDRDSNAQIIGALMTGFAQTAQVVSAMLTKETLTEAERATLRASLGAGVITVAKAVNEVRPGLGDVVLQIYLGQELPGTGSDAER